MAAEKDLTMKLLIDTRTNKVLFAEAGKEEVDFLFWLLTLPLASVVKLLNKENMGSLGTMYGSLERLDSTYFQDTNKKNLLLNPKVLSSSSSSTHNTLPLLAAEDRVATSYYKCSYCSAGFYTDISGTRCPSCKWAMTNMLTYVDPETGKGEGNAKVEGEGAVGYVKGMVTYTVMDDLTVMPMSAISNIDFFKKFNVRSVDVLREETVKLGMQEGLELLRVSLKSKKVLTDVFLEKKRNLRGGVLRPQLGPQNQTRVVLRPPQNQRRVVLRPQLGPGNLRKS